MTNTTKTAGFITCNEYVIWSIGDTEEAAMNEARENATDGDISGLSVFPATTGLIRTVEERGGAIAWSIVGGIACERDEGRKSILAALAAGADKAEIEAEIATVRNITLAEIDTDDGGVWIEGVQGNRWLSDDEITEVMRKIA